MQGFSEASTSYILVLLTKSPAKVVPFRKPRAETVAIFEHLDMEDRADRNTFLTLNVALTLLTPTLTLTLKMEAHVGRQEYKTASLIEKHV